MRGRGTGGTGGPGETGDGGTGAGVSMQTGTGSERWCGAHQCPGVGICPLVQQQLGDPVVSTVGGHVERRQVVQSHIVHRSLMLQQVLDTVNVVPLRPHVERGQPVLEGQEEVEVEPCGSHEDRKVS